MTRREPRFNHHSLRRVLATSRRRGHPAPHQGAARLQESTPTQLELDLYGSCAQRHRSTAQGTRQRCERRGWCGTRARVRDERMTSGDTTTKTKTASTHAILRGVETKPDRENKKPPFSRTKPDECEDECKDEAEGESRRRRGSRGPRQEEEED